MNMVEWIYLNWISYVPAALMYSILFCDFRKYSKKVHFLVPVGSMTIFAFAVGFANYYFNVTMALDNIITAGIGITFCVLAYYFINISACIYTYMVILMFEIITFISGVSIYSETLLNSPVIEVFCDVLRVLIQIGISWLLWQYMRQIFKNQKSDKIWLKMCIPNGICCIAMIFYYNIFVILEKDKLFEAMLFYVVIFICSTLSNVFSIAILINANEAQEYKSQLRMAQNQIENQQKSYESMIENVESSRRKNHDMRHHMRVLEGLIQQNKEDELREYMTNISESMDPDVIIHYTGQYALDTLLYHFQQRAKDNQVDFQIHLEFKKITGIQEMNFTVILGNCLENAFEATEKLSPENRKVLLSGKKSGSMLYICFKNTYDGICQKEQQKFLSSKRDFKECGIGLQSVEHLVKSQNGIIQYDTNEEQFEVYIMLEMKME